MCSSRIRGDISTAYDEEKLAELVLYVAGRLTDEAAAGATKLNKLLFFAEFAHVRRHGEAITGAEYQRLPNGPAPRRLLPVRERLLAQGDAELVQGVFLGRIQERLVPRREPDLSRFSAAELATVDDVLDQLRTRTGTELSDLSHEEPGWNLVAEGETIPYETAFLRAGPASLGVLAHAAELRKKHSPT